jgi:hypothetical protein
MNSKKKGLLNLMEDFETPQENNQEEIKIEDEALAPDEQQATLGLTPDATVTTINILERIEADRKAKKTIEDTHTRRTFLIRNDILKELDRICRGKRGYATQVVNLALEKALVEIKESKKKGE